MTYIESAVTATLLLTALECGFWIGLIAWAYYRSVKQRQESIEILV
jgi:hypothetical protein